MRPQSQHVGALIQLLFVAVVMWICFDAREQLAKLNVRVEVMQGSIARLEQKVDREPQERPRREWVDRGEP